MKLEIALHVTKLARSRSEARRLVKQGAVKVGGCSKDCEFFNTGRCNCGGWTKAMNPLEDVEAGVAIKVGNGLWRLMSRLDGSSGFDQVNGIARVPSEVEETPSSEIENPETESSQFKK